jgi:hypothetical protein
MSAAETSNKNPKANQNINIPNIFIQIIILKV